jgi:haloalkane dehalogenase
VKVLRTPDERFEHLDGYDFVPHYHEVTAADGTSLRLHFVDEGPSDAAPVLLLHGNPSWSYIHRDMIRGLVDCGHRVVALAMIEGANHFIQEDAPSELVRVIDDFVRSDRP